MLGKGLVCGSLAGFQQCARIVYNPVLVGTHLNLTCVCLVYRCVLYGEGGGIQWLIVAVSPSDFARILYSYHAWMLGCFCFLWSFYFLYHFPLCSCICNSFWGSINQSINWLQMWERNTTTPQYSPPPPSHTAQPHAWNCRCFSNSMWINEWMKYFIWVTREMPGLHD